MPGWPRTRRRSSRGRDSRTAPPGREATAGRTPVNRASPGRDGMRAAREHSYWSPGRAGHPSSARGRSPCAARRRAWPKTRVSRGRPRSHRAPGARHGATAGRTRSVSAVPAPQEAGPRGCRPSTPGLRLRASFPAGQPGSRAAGVAQPGSRARMVASGAVSSARTIWPRCSGARRNAPLPFSGGTVIVRARTRRRCPSRARLGRRAARSRSALLRPRGAPGGRGQPAPAAPSITR